MLEKFDKNKNPFRVPENYFESFNTEIMDKLPEKAKIVPLWRKIVPWTAVAAVFFGILFTTGVFRQSAITDPTTIAGQYDTKVANGITYSSSMEDDYFLFIEDEVASARYSELMYSN